MKEGDAPIACWGEELGIFNESPVKESTLRACFIWYPNPNLAQLFNPGLIVIPNHS